MENYYKSKGMDKFPIIQKLQGTGFEEQFINLVNFAVPILDGGPLLKSIGFTPHDFSHHCKNIYKILERILPEEFYIQNRAGENLFVLLVSVLFHDIGMTKEWSEKVRNEHSLLSREFILEHYENNDVNSVIMQNLKKVYAEYVGDIIYAHSDIKENGVLKIDTFDEICQKYEEKRKPTMGEHEKINVPFLTALLRLADELDISYERIENTYYSKMKNIPSSFQHFRLCELFENVGKDGDTLIIEVDERKYNTGEEHEKSSKAASIIERYEKICKEFRMLKDRVLCNTKHASADIWDIRKIQLVDEEKFIEQAKKKEL